MPDEREIFQGSPSQWENFGVFLVASPFSYLVFPIFWGVWRYLVTRCTRYEVTSERISVLVLRALKGGRELRENLRGAIEKIREARGVRELDV